MISSKSLSSLAPVLTLLVIVLGAWMWALEPEKSLRWGIGMIFLPAAWISIILFQRSKACRNILEGGKQNLMLGISFAGIMLAGTFALKISQNYHIIDDSSPDRLVAVMLGAFMVVIGNALPKKLEPFGEEKCAPTQLQSLKRFAGWMFVLAGFGYAMAWLVLPDSLADKVALPILAVPVLLVIARTTWLRLVR